MLRIDVDCGVVCLFGEKGCEGGNGTCEDCVDIVDYINDDVYWKES